MTAHLKLVPATEVKQTENSGRQSNTAYRDREYMTEDEVLKLLQALKRNRQGHRDWLMGLLAYRHGLRVSELIDLKWSDFNEAAGQMLVRRLKGSQDNSHFLEADEINALRRLRREGPTHELYIFKSERDHFTRDGFAKMIKRAGEAAGLPFPCHPHMLRHACGFKLANAGVETRDLQNYLGHKNIMSTVRYTALVAKPLPVKWKR